MTERGDGDVPDRARGLEAATAAVAALVHSNVFVSVAASSVVVTTSVLAGFPLEATPVFVVFAATMFVYSLDRVTDLEADEVNVPRRAAFTRAYGGISLAVGLALYLGAVALAVVRGLPLVEFLALPLVAAVGYSMLRLKRLLLVKNLLVGVAWGVVPLGVGVYHGDLLRPEVLFLSAHVAVMITVAAAIFDLKDVEGDETAGIRTAPTVYGPRVTRLAAQAVNVAVAVAVVALVASDVLARPFLALCAFHCYVGCYVAVARETYGSLFYGFVVDGEHVFLAIVTLVLVAPSL